MVYNKEEYKSSLIPQSSGIYIFRDCFGKILYVGKGKNLRKRMASYFRPSRLKVSDIRLRSLIKSIAQFEFFVVKNESEALLLESRFIKEYSPQYNILLRDDKRFLMIKINLKETFPRLTLTRLKKDDSAIYFGPFPRTRVLKNTVDYLNRYFKLRPCSFISPTIKDRKHCHQHFLRYCSSPCDKSISKKAYGEKIQAILAILNGEKNSLIDELKKEMINYAAKEKFEKAAFIRDIIENLFFLSKKRRNFSYYTIKNDKDILAQLQQELNLPSIPVIIEAFDNSHFQGQHTVSSFVRFVNGKPHNQSYRHYKIKTVDKVDDFATMYEVVYRRYNRILQENKSFPNLILIDGGKGQLSSACAALGKLNLKDIPILGLAKRQEEIFLPNNKNSLLLPPNSPSLKLLQHIRDEAHRFAINFHRHLRRKCIINSVLDDIPNIGVKRKEQILMVFGSVKKLRTASVEEIIERVDGINRTLATVIYNYLSRS